MHFFLDSRLIRWLVVLSVEALQCPELSRVPPLLIPAPGRLNEAGGPSPPLVRVESKLMPKLLAMEPPKLARHELEILSPEGEGLDLGYCLDGPGGGGEDDAGARVEGPREELLAAEVPWTDAAGVKEAGSTTVGGVGIEVPSYNKQHFIHGVALPH